MIERRTVEHVAILARVAIPDGRIEDLVAELDEILGCVAQLEELDVSGIPPLTHAEADTNVYREDTPLPCLPRDQALGNAPDTRDGFFRVPRVVEGG
jgi:aspartyl-tRNA(Asn)/glutamyl-tRNA(Gln) amidotransferase subunit C